MLEMYVGYLWPILTFNLLLETEALRLTIPEASTKLHGFVSCVGFLGMRIGLNANELMRR